MNKTKAKTRPVARAPSLTQLPSRQAQRRDPTVRFSPAAWAKLLYLRDLGDTEVGGFGISAADDLLRIEDFCLVRQRTTAVTVVLDDGSVADFYDQQVDAGRVPQQFGRIWIHTHPGNCPRPSLTDEATFAAAFGRMDWALMLILARGGASYARLRFNVGPRGSLRLAVRVDYCGPFPASDHAAWEREYQEHVLPQERKRPAPGGAGWDESSLSTGRAAPGEEDLWNDWRFDDF